MSKFSNNCINESCMLRRSFYKRDNDGHSIQGTVGPYADVMSLRLGKPGEYTYQRAFGTGIQAGFDAALVQDNRRFDGGKDICFSGNAHYGAGILPGGEVGHNFGGDATLRMKGAFAGFGSAARLGGVEFDLYGSNDNFLTGSKKLSETQAGIGLGLYYDSLPRRVRADVTGTFGYDSKKMTVGDNIFRNRELVTGAKARLEYTLPTENGGFTFGAHGSFNVPVADLNDGFNNPQWGKNMNTDNLEWECGAHIKYVF